MPENESMSSAGRLAALRNRKRDGASPISGLIGNTNEPASEAPKQNVADAQALAPEPVVVEKSQPEPVQEPKPAPVRREAPARPARPSGERARSGRAGGAGLTRRGPVTMQESYQWYLDHRFEDVPEMPEKWELEDLYVKTVGHSKSRANVNVRLTQDLFGLFESIRANLGRWGMPPSMRPKSDTELIEMLAQIGATAILQRFNGGKTLPALDEEEERVDYMLREPAEYEADENGPR